MTVLHNTQPKMSLKIYLQAEHICERCGETTWIDMVRPGSSGQPGDIRADVLMAMDCDADNCRDCLGLLEDQARVEAAHRRRTVEFDPASEDQRPAVEDYDQRPCLGKAA